MNAAKALCLAQENGVQVFVADGDLILDAKREPAAPILEALRQHKPSIISLLVAAKNNSAVDDLHDNFEEHAAIIEFDARIPREWAEGFARLCVMPRHPDFTEDRWQSLIDDAGTFMDRWAVTVAAKGWTALEVFGVDNRKPYARIDQMGLIPLLGGKDVIAVSADSVTIQSFTGVRQTIFRGNNKKSPGRVTMWDIKFSI
jgi:hypothetical protein